MALIDMKHAGVALKRTAGDVEALYRSERERLFRSLVAYCGRMSVAEDAVAEAFAQLLRNTSNIEHPKAWVWHAAFRIAAGELHRAPAALDVAPPSLEVDPDTLALIEALSQLSVLQRGSVVLHHYAGYPTEEVATMLESTPTAVRVHLHRGRARLREILEAEQ